MGSFRDIITDTSVTNYISRMYMDLSEQECSTLDNLYETNDKMINYWLGDSSLTMQNALSTVENQLVRVFRYTSNSGEVTAASSKNATYADADRGKSITINTIDGDG